MRVHCVLEKDRYSTKVYHSEIGLKTVIEVSIDDDDLYDGFTEVDDVIIVLKESDGEDFKHYLHREPKPCPICGTKPIRKQCHFKVGEGENRYDNEHHEDGTLKWTWLECETCGRKTLAYCYEHQATDFWNEDKIDGGDTE